MIRLCKNCDTKLVRTGKTFHSEYCPKCSEEKTNKSLLSEALALLSHANNILVIKAERCGKDEFLIPILSQQIDDFLIKNKLKSARKQ